MFPEFLKIPGIDFTINTYGVLIAIAFLCGTLLAARQAEKDGLKRDTMYDLCMFMLIASLVGSRALLVLTEWQEFAENPLSIFSLHFLRSGGVFYGGLLGAMLASVFLMKRYQLPWWLTADACAPGIALGQFWGRLGCFAAGCCWGKPTDSWCGVQFTAKAHELTGVPIDHALHPTQMYESVATLGLCLFLVYFRKHRAFHGQIVLLYLFLYGLIRFSIEFFRDDPRGSVWTFGAAPHSLWTVSTSQFIALLFIFSALAGYFFLRNPKTRPTGLVGGTAS